MPNLWRTRSNWRSFIGTMFSPSISTSPESGFSRPMRCLSKTLLPPPLRPMMTTDSPFSMLKIDAIEDRVRAEALFQVAHLDHNGVQQSCQDAASGKSW